MTLIERLEALSGADRELLLSVHPQNEAIMGGPASVLRFTQPDLVELVGINHPIFGGHYRLSKLGMALRARRADNG